MCYICANTTETVSLAATDSIGEAKDTSILHKYTCTEVKYFDNMNYRKGLYEKMMYEFGDKHALYIDGSSGGLFFILHNFSAKNRADDGFKYGLEHAKTIIDMAQKNNESIKVITHSMGGAFGKGFIDGICLYGKLNGIDVKNLIAFELDLAPFQPAEQHVVDNVKTIVISHKYDGIAGCSPIPKADNYTTRKNILFFLVVCILLQCCSNTE